MIQLEIRKYPDDTYGNTLTKYWKIVTVDIISNKEIEARQNTINIQFDTSYCSNNVTQYLLTTK